MSEAWGNGHPTRVAVWSAYKPLEAALCELVNGAAALQSVALPARRPTAQSIREIDPDVLILDCDGWTNEASGLIRQLASGNSRLPIVVISTHSDSPLSSFVLSAGAVGYILKDRAFEELRPALQAVLDGRRYVSSAVPCGDGGPNRPRSATDSPERGIGESAGCGANVSVGEAANQDSPDGRWERDTELSE